MLDTIVSLGFKNVYLLPPDPLRSWAPGPNGAGAGLFADPGAAYPRATAIMLLVYPYAPFAPGERIPAYYLASNEAYFKVKELISLIAKTAYAERAQIPLRAFALEHSIGSLGKNGLLRIPPYGSSFILDAIATDAFAPASFTSPSPVPCPENCTLCAAACPSGAISAAGRDAARCMRLYMRTAEHPSAVRERQLHYIGCEACLRACPFNAALGYAKPASEAVAAFAAAALIRGDTAAARRLAGKNMTGGGKLTAEAIVFAARDGASEQALETASASPFPAVQSALKWAKSRYFIKT